ncbi:MAG TPA: Na+/galactose cotransporter, partial [Ornithinibacter sp.]|nr:Na+/galactose cotransporter [Ornithinibacter sp.]
PLGGQGAAFVAASAAFLVDFALSIGISLFTAPTPQEDLVGLVYSETPKETRQDPLEHTYPWYRRTLPLAGLSLAMVTVLNILF